jgi:hypothetical protein
MPERKSMCWIRDEWSEGCLYSFYKCKHEPLAHSQYKGMDAPLCPGKCDGFIEIHIVLICAILVIALWAILEINQMHNIEWRFIH